MTGAPFNPRLEMRPPARSIRPRSRMSFITKIGVASGYITLLVGALNVVLRLSDENSLTPFYIIGIVHPVLWAWSQGGLRWFSLLPIVGGYGFFAAVYYGTPIELYLPQIVHYFYVILLCCTLHYLKISDPFFERNIMRFLWSLIVAIFILAFLQLTVGLILPYTSSAHHMYYNAFFYGPNDLGLFIGAFAILVLARPYRMSIKVGFIAAVALLNIVNDARAALLALFVSAGAYSYIRFSHRLKVPPFVSMGFGSLVALAGVGVAANIDFNLGGTDIQLVDLVIDPIRHLMNLEGYSESGSVYDRTNGLIFCTLEFLKTYGIGLGPSGSIYVLSMPQYALPNAESLHNLVAELAVDMGYLFIVPAVVWSVRTLNRSILGAFTHHEAAKFTLLASLPLLSVTQSAGYISNFGFWTIFYLIVFGFTTTTSKGRARSRARLRYGPSPMVGPAYPRHPT